MANNVYGAIAAVMGEVGYVQKSGFNSAQNYRYAGETDLIDALRPAMLKHGLVAQVVGWEPHFEQYQTAKGDVRLRAAGVATVRFTHVESGSYVEVKALGEGVDASDKASYKAMTGALKYALRQTFLIETGTDPEKDEEKPAVAHPPVSHNTPAARPSPAPAASGLMVAMVKSHEGVSAKTGKPYTKYEIEFSDGRKASTFSGSIADAANEAWASGASVSAEIRPASNPKWPGDLVSLEVVA